MSNNLSPTGLSSGRIYTKETLINGKPGYIQCVDIEGKTYAINNGLLTIVELEDEWYEDVKNPAKVIDELKKIPGLKADIFKFWQRMPEVEPKYDYYHEFIDIAVLPVTSYDNWWNKQIKSRVRSQIRKSEKDGIEIRETPYDDDFVKGMTAIFNESPIRQGRKFWHYGKDFETVKKQFSRFIHREQMIGAYYQNEMIGFVMLGNAGKFGITGQIISGIKHRDKSPNNALIAKAVEICASQNLDYLIYFYWTEDSLAEFKRRCGFQKETIPQYYVPLTFKGSLAIKYGAHRGVKAMLPEHVKITLKSLRKMWHGYITK